jgi:hypothetical protein
VLAPVLIVVADIIIFMLVGTLGRRTTGQGARYRPFTGGEKNIPVRGTYRSNLFVFAVLFMVVEAFALLLASSFESPGKYYPLLFLLGGSGVITLTVWWYIVSGNGEF